MNEKNEEKEKLVSLLTYEISNTVKCSGVTERIVDVHPKGRLSGWAVTHKQFEEHFDITWVVKLPLISHIK